MSRLRGPSPYRKPWQVRVGELLTSHPAIWLVGFTLGITFLVLTSLVGVRVGVALTVPLVLVATAGLVVKDRVLILRRRILFTRQRMSRRQVLAMMLSIAIVAGLAAAFGRLLGYFILGGYDEQVRRYMTRTPRPPKK